MNAFEHFIVIDQLCALDCLFMPDQFGAFAGWTINDQLPFQNRPIPGSNDPGPVGRLDLSSGTFALLFIVRVLILQSFIQKGLILLADALSLDGSQRGGIAGRIRNAIGGAIEKSGESEATEGSDQLENFSALQNESRQGNHQQRDDKQPDWFHQSIEQPVGHDSGQENQKCQQKDAHLFRTRQSTDSSLFVSLVTIA
jgi:hypothetical protein